MLLFFIWVKGGPNAVAQGPLVILRHLWGTHDMLFFLLLSRFFKMQTVTHKMAENGKCMELFLSSNLLFIYLFLQVDIVVYFILLK